MNKVALVTDLKVVDSPQAGLGVARCLKEAGFDIIGVDDTPFINCNSSLFKKTFCWEEIRTLNFDSLIKKIIDLQKIYGLDFIFPCYDETVILLSFLKDKLDYLGVKLIAPSINVLKEIRKSNLSKLIINSDNYQTPVTKIVFSIVEVIEGAKSIGYPVVCKGLTKGSYICENENSLIENVKKISKIWNNGKISCLIQKYISGKHENCIVALIENEIAGYVEMTKIGMDQNGATWFGKIKKTTELLKLAGAITRKLTFGTSIIEIETINNDGTYYICEINPRSPAWIYATCQLGLNIPVLVTKSLESSSVRFIEEEGYFGRETREFIRKDIDNYGDNLDFYSKAAAYKRKNMSYPSDLLP